MSQTEQYIYEFKYLTNGPFSCWVRDMHEMHNFKIFHATQLKIKDHVYKIQI
jgi:hypothetical protein